MMGFFDALAGALRTPVTSFVTPPVGFLWIALLGVLVGRMWRRAGRIAVAIGLLGLYVAGTSAASDLLIGGLEGPFDVPPVADPGAIVVLGGDGHRTPDDNVAMPGPLSAERIAGGAGLARATGLPILITGGGVGEGQPPVSELMARSLDRDFGLQPRWLEEQAENTCQNASFSAAILRQAGIGSAYLVTHSWHMRRALLSFARAGYPVRPAPLPAEHHGFSRLSDYVPHVSGWVRSYYAFHEWIGLVAYRLGACPETGGR